MSGFWAELHGDLAGWIWEPPDAGVRARITSRAGGVSRDPWATLNLGAAVGDDAAAVAENRSRVAATLPDGHVIHTAHQVHGAALAVTPGAAAAGVSGDSAVSWAAGRHGPDADAIAFTAGEAAAVLVADCMPILLVGDGVHAVVHAGWRGLLAGVVERTARQLGTVRAVAVGPRIGACCFEVGEDVAAMFTPAARVHGRGDRPHVDQLVELDQRLARAGAPAAGDLGICTVCDDRCFSHRGDGGTTGRQALIAW